MLSDDKVTAAQVDCESALSRVLNSKQDNDEHRKGGGCTEPPLFSIHCAQRNLNRD